MTPLNLNYGVVEVFQKILLSREMRKKERNRDFFCSDLILSKHAFSDDRNPINRKLHPSEAMFQNITCIFMCFMCLFMWSVLRRRWFM